MSHKLKIISLGWGVQSWTLAAMAALGEIEKPDLAIHSDTTFEMSHTYSFAREWTAWLEERGIPVITVSDPRATHIMKKSSTSEGTYTLMPVFTLNEDNSKGQLRRQCTSRWKIEPLHRTLSQAFAATHYDPSMRDAKYRDSNVSRIAAMLEAKNGANLEKSPGFIQQQLGISMDEWQRMKTSPVEWIENTYPLVDLRMSRDDCLRWLGAHDLPSPGKSACRQCPFRSSVSWAELKRANGQDWKDAVAADEALRATGRSWYLHTARIPLSQAVQTAEDKGQFRLFDDDEADPTCDSGHCFL